MSVATMLIDLVLLVKTRLDLDILLDMWFSMKF